MNWDCRVGPRGIEPHFDRGPSTVEGSSKTAVALRSKAIASGSRKRTIDVVMCLLIAPPSAPPAGSCNHNLSTTYADAR